MARVYTFGLNRKYLKYSFVKIEPILYSCKFCENLGMISSLKYIKVIKFCISV